MIPRSLVGCAFLFWVSLLNPLLPAGALQETQDIPADAKMATMMVSVVGKLLRRERRNDMQALKDQEAGLRRTIADLERTVADNRAAETHEREEFEASILEPTEPVIGQQESHGEDMASLFRQVREMQIAGEDLVHTVTAQGARQDDTAVQLRDLKENLDERFQTMHLAGRDIIRAVVQDELRRQAAASAGQDNALTEHLHERLMDLEGSSAESSARAEAASTMVEELRAFIFPPARVFSIHLPQPPSTRRASLAIASVPADSTGGSNHDAAPVYGPEPPPSAPAGVFVDPSPHLPMDTAAFIPPAPTENSANIAAPGTVRDVQMADDLD